MVYVEIIALESIAAKDGCDGVCLPIGQVDYLRWHLGLGTTIAQQVRRCCSSMVWSEIGTSLRKGGQC